MFSTRAVVAFIVCLSLSVAVYADVIPVSGNTADRQVSATSMPWVGQPDMRVGVGSTEGSCAVFVFELPVLPDGMWVETGELAFSVVGGNNWRHLYQKGMDLYAVRMAASAAVQQSDYYKGPYDGDPAAMAIQDHIVYEPLEFNQGAPGEIGRHQTSAASEAALGAWLADIYADAAYDPAGSNYVFLRLSARDDVSSDYRYWSVASADNQDEDVRPVLTITAIPEPATLALLALGGLAVVRRKP